ncbi:MAG TPA: hypothetical protein VFL14_12335, partial [Xanthomonadales bacterium]|nr:hypothetical protein [Xanthomonadales bacterium]
MDGRLKGACLLAATLALAGCEGDAAAPAPAPAPSATKPAPPATKLASKPAPTRPAAADVERILAPLREKLEA